MLLLVFFFFGGKHQMPLFNIVGITPTNQTFMVCQISLSILLTFSPPTCCFLHEWRSTETLHSWWWWHFIRFLSTRNHAVFHTWWDKRGFQVVIGVSHSVVSPSWRGPIVWSCDNDRALLETLKKLFPSSAMLLCKWHINKDVSPYIKRHFPKGRAHEELCRDWNAIIMADTKAGYHSSWQTLRQKYEGTHPVVVRYLEKTWLKHDKNIISCFPCRVGN